MWYALHDDMDICIICSLYGEVSLTIELNQPKIGLCSPEKEMKSVWLTIKKTSYPRAYNPRHDIGTLNHPN